MLKKLMAVCSLGLVTTISFAGNFYLGPSISMQDVLAKDASYRGVNPKLSLGFGGNLSELFYLGSEINASFGSLTLNENRDDLPSLKMTNSYAISILPGFNLTKDTLAFIRLGVVTSYFTGPEKRAMGEQLGFGLKTRFTQSWSMRGEYIFTDYQSVSGIGSPISSAFVLSFIHDF